MERDLEREIQIQVAKFFDSRKLSTNENDISLELLENGSVYHKQGKNDEALKYYNKFIESKKRSKVISIETAIDTIAEIFYYERKYELSMKYNIQSLEMKRQTLPLNHRGIAIKLNNIGSVYQMQGKYEEALKYFKQSLEMNKETLPSNDFLAAVTINNIGVVYYMQRKYDEALNFFNQSLEMKKQTLPSNHREIGVTLNYIGLLYQNQGKHEEALKYLNETLEIYKQILPPNDFRIAKTLDNIRLAYEKLVKCYNHSKRIVSQTPEETINAGNSKEELLKANVSLERENSEREDLKKEIKELKVIVSNQENKLNEVLAVLLKVLETKKQKEPMENDNQKIEQTKLDGQNQKEASDNENKTENEPTELKQLRDILSTFELI